jgi:glycosyltransferase involved in cell wall biosynthesis
VYHGLNPDFARLVARPTVSAPDGPLRLVSIGTAVEKKGFDVLIEALALVRAAGVDARLVLAGEPGPADATIAAAIGRHDVGHVVERHGPLSQPALVELLAASDAFVLACRIAGDGDRDGIPNVLVEAMAAGVAVVSTRVSGIPELVTDGCDGLLVEPDDATALAAAITRLAADPALRTRLAAAGRRTVAERFDGDVLTRRLAVLMGAAS